jgi:hypothetical protein
MHVTGRRSNLNVYPRRYPRKTYVFSDCELIGFSLGIGGPGRRNNASFNHITLKSIGFS